MRIGSPTGEYTITSCSVNVTLQTASHMGPILTSVFENKGMIWPSHGMAAPYWDTGIVAVAIDNYTCLVAIPTRSLGEE